MKVAILGGGISGLTAAYECHKQGLDWNLYEASNRLGGIVETTRPAGFVLEHGPDGWVSEKPWARDLAIELGLESDLILSNDATRVTYIAIDGELQAMPARMRLFVPENLDALDDSPLFSAEAKAAYAAELANAAALKNTSPFTDEHHDESVATFVRRHFGPEVLSKLAAPLLSGVFGGNVETLSVRAVMPQFVTMERDHGSLIAALQARSQSANPPPIFTSLRHGMASLTEALAARLPAERLHLNRPALSLKREGKLLALRIATPGATGRIGKAKKHVHQVLLATPLDATAGLLAPLLPGAAPLLPSEASSSILVNLTWNQPLPNLPQGFGFLAPSTGAEPQLLAATFAHQKFPHRAPANAAILRAFFGGASADALADATDESITETALTQLQTLLGPLPAPHHTTVRRWPRALPQYAVGHLDRIAQLDAQVATIPGLTLLGNSYRGVGLPDLVRDARSAVRRIAAK